jgi:hypothetical protein
MSTLSQLKTALGSNDGEQIRYALSAYLKEDVRASSELLRPEPIDKSCGAGVDANTCASVIQSCLEGGNVGQCVNTLESISGQLKDGIRGMNSELAFRVCKNLGIELGAVNPKVEWISRIQNSDAAAAAKIANNSVLQHIIGSFIVAAQNPLVDSKSADFTQRRIELTATIKPRSPRMLVKVQSGGGMGRSSFNKYVQYADSLKTVVSMRGGAGQPILNKTYDELANIYNNFVNSLRAQGKQIDSNDNERIRQLLSELKYTEEKLSKVVQYIAKYNEVRNNPAFRDELAASPVTASLLEDLNKKYEGLQEKQKKKVFNFLSISDALNKAISDVDEIKETLKGRFGAPSVAAPAASAPAGLVAAPPSSRFGPLAASPASPASPAASPAPSAADVLAGQRARADAEAARQAELTRQLANGVPVARAEAIARDVYNRVLARNGPAAGTPSAAGLFGDMSTVKKYFNY